MAVALLVLASAVVRSITSLWHVTPYYFADEYIYPALARGIADEGAPVVRGTVAAFPAMLEPLQTAVFHLLFAFEPAIRLTQMLHAVEMSLAAVPVFLLARRLELTGAMSVACAAVAVTSPALFWAGFTTADALGYVLALTAVYAATSALAQPRPSAQLLFVVTATLATLARTQYVVLFGIVAIAAVAVERGSVRRAVSAHRLVLAPLAVGVAAFVVAATAGMLGPYSAWLGVGVDPGVAARSVGLDLAVVGLAAGAVVLPGAIVGLDLVLSRPRSRDELALGVVALLLVTALLGLAALGTEPRVQERYLAAAAPLPALMCALWIARGKPRRSVAIVIAVPLAGAYAAVQLTGWEAAHSPTLRALEELERITATAAAPRLAAAAIVLAAVPLVVARRRTALGTLALALLVTSAISAGAHSFDRTRAADVRDARLPERKDWVDALRLGEVALLHAPKAERVAPFQQLFWNESVRRVIELPDSEQLDFFDVANGRILSDGTLTADRVPVTSPLLVPRQGTTFRFMNGTLLRRTNDFDLVRPRTGRLRVSMATFGRYSDGWLAPTASIRAWPASASSRPQRLGFVLSLPRDTPGPATVRLSRGEMVRFIRVAPGERVPVVVRATGNAPLRIGVRTDRVIELGRRVVAIRMSLPQLR